MAGDEGAEAKGEVDAVFELVNELGVVEGVLVGEDGDAAKACDLSGAGADEPAEGVEVVAGFGKDAAAGHGKEMHPAFFGGPGASKGGSGDGDNSADCSTIDKGFYFLVEGKVAVLFADHENAVVEVGGFIHPVAFGNTHCHGFFDHDIVSGVEGIDDLVDVEAMGGCYQDGVQVGVLEHLARLGIDCRISFGNLQPVVESVGTGIAQGENFAVGAVVDALDVLPAAVTDADDAEF